MSETFANNKRIAKNTLFLYFRMLLLMGIGLYTSRITLQTLGVEDFGTYNVVGGFVAMFSVFTGSLSNAVSRFIQVELGKGNIEKLKEVFATSVTIQSIMAFIGILLAEIVGLWFLYNKMNIPQGSEIAAQWVFHCSVISFAIGLINVPYNSAIIAHEKMSAFAYISIFEAILKLCVVFSLICSPFNKLITYAVLLLIVSSFLRLVYWLYCKKHFIECTYKLHLNLNLLKEMGDFAGWNMLSTLGSVMNNHGINILMNIFFGVVVNAARGVSNQVNNAIQGLINNFTMALTPVIVKEYAAGNKSYAFKLVCRGSKYAYLLMFFVSLPIIFEADYILKIWLKNPPDYSVEFLRWTIAATLVNVFGNNMYNLVMADGNIKSYQLVTTLCSLLPFPLTWILFKFGYPPVSTFIILFVINVLLIFVRFYMAKRVTGLSVRDYIFGTIIKVSLVSILSAIFPMLIFENMEKGFLRFLTVSIACVLSTVIITYLFGLQQEEREVILRKVMKIFKKK